MFKMNLMAKSEWISISWLKSVVIILRGAVKS